jgi:hypothetical protein
VQTNAAGVVDRLGTWARRRTEPRLWVTLAGAGCLLAVIGILIISTDAKVGDEGNVDGSNVPGIVLCLLVVLAGYVLAHRFGEAPAGAAGVAAIVLALPALIVFLTLDVDAPEPVSIEAVLAVPAVVWIVSYLVGPGKGRPLLLGAGLVFAWLFALQVAEDPVNEGIDTGPVFEEPLGSEDDGFVEDDFGGDVGGDSFEETGETDQATGGIVSLVIGAAYLVGVALLDRRGWRGAGTPFAVAAHAALPTGILLLSPDLEVAGTGVALVIVGLVTSWVGALGARRATTIIGAIETVAGIGLLVGDTMEDSDPSSVGLALVVIGIAIAVGAHVLHILTGEPPQTREGPSSFPGRPRQPAAAYAGGPAYGAAAPYAGSPQFPGQPPSRPPYAGPPPGGAPGAPPPPPPPPQPPAGGPGGPGGF